MALSRAEILSSDRTPTICPKMPLERASCRAPTFRCADSPRLRALFVSHKHCLQLINDIMSEFEGRHSYQSFTRIAAPRTELLSVGDAAHACAPLVQALDALLPVDSSDSDALLRLLAALRATHSTLGRSRPARAVERLLGGELEQRIDEHCTAPTSAEVALLDAVRAGYAHDTALFHWRLRQCIFARALPVYERRVSHAACTSVHMPNTDTPWVALHFTGESFVYHQIRRMVGAVGAVLTGMLSRESLRMALQIDSPFWMRIPVVPGELVGGLFLWCPFLTQKLQARI